MTTPTNTPGNTPETEPTKRPVRWGDRVKPTHTPAHPRTPDTPSTNGASPERATRALFIVITAQDNYGNVSTSSHDLTVPVGTRHHDLLTYLLNERIAEHMRGNAIVLHYSVHPAVVT